jgi:HSP20 family protein
MAIRDLVTKSGKKSVPIQKSQGDPISALHQELNRVFDSFSRGFFDMSPLSTHLLESSSWGGFSPQVDIRESEKDIEVTAELPGLDEKDVQVSLANNELVIRGEKKTESEEKRKGWHRIERSYGSFHRTVALPEGVDTAKADAVLKKGLLTVTIPKTAGSRASSQTKKIAIHRG